MAEQGKLELDPLYPTDDAKGIEGQTAALNFAFSKEKILNIALTGGYGTGKSSVIETYKDKEYNEDSEDRQLVPREKPLRFIHLAFTHFQPYDSTDTECTLEAKILNQLVHQVPAGAIPYTRFPVKREWTRKQEAIAAAVIVAIAMCATYIGYHMKHFGQMRLLALTMPRQALIVAAFAVGIGLLAFAAYYAIYFIYRSGAPKKVKGKDFEVEFDRENCGDAGLTLFDRYLTEILYILDKVKADAIVIEDLDRSKDNQIFTQLREICRLANLKREEKRKEVEKIDKSKIPSWFVSKRERQRSKPLRFIYLLKDEKFNPEDRTKFFDLIIPVMPVTGGGEKTISMIWELLERYGIKRTDEKMGALVAAMGNHVTDYRLLKNIANEYFISWKSLNLIENRDKAMLLAFTVYKNLFPEDYSALRAKHEGMIYDLVIDGKKTVTAPEGCNRLHALLLNWFVDPQQGYITKEYPKYFGGDVKFESIRRYRENGRTDWDTVLQLLRRLNGSGKIAPYDQTLVVPWANHKWRVLEVKNNQALLLSEYILFEEKFNEEGKGNAWENSALQIRLKEEFAKMFDTATQERVEGKQWFPLSREDILEYFNTKSCYMFKEDGYIYTLQANGTYSQSYSLDNEENWMRCARKEGDEQMSWWWLRSPGNITGSAAFVDDDGDVDFGGDVVQAGGGVRPALWLNL